jgi:hypothetical protein
VDDDDTAVEVDDSDDVDVDVDADVEDDEVLCVVWVTVCELLVVVVDTCEDLDVC